MRIALVIALSMSFLALPHRAADPAGFVVVIQTANGKLSFQAVEGFQIGGRDKVRAITQITDSVTDTQYRGARSVPLSLLGLLRKDEQGRLIRLSGEPRQRALVLPDGLKSKGAMKVAGVLSETPLTLVKSRRAKQTAQLPMAEFFALISTTNPSYDAMDFVLSEANFFRLEEQLAAIEGVVPAFRNTQDVNALREYLLTKLRDGLNAFEEGGAYSDLLRIVRYAETAQRAFADDKRIQIQAASVSERKVNTERAVARLTSLTNNQDWDTFLDQYLSFEPYQWSFPEVMEQRRKAIQESVRLHVQRGNELAAQKRYREGVAEYDVAAQRDPDNGLIAENRERILHDYAASQAEAQREASKPLPEGSMDLRLFRRYIDFASQYTKNKKYEEALAELQKAEELKRDAPEILLGKAEVCSERGELWKALPLLDEFDRVATTKDLKARGDTLRNKVLFDRTNKKSAFKQKFPELLAAGSFGEAETLAQEALQTDQNDDEFNYYSGIAFALVNRTGLARSSLKRYLDLSVSLRGDLRRRSLANRVMTLLEKPPAAQGKGARNWFSGRQLPEGSFYCSESGAFQPQVAVVEGFHMAAEYVWTPEGRLRSIKLAFHDLKGTRSYEEMVARNGISKTPGHPSFYFFYHPNYPQVLKAVPSVLEPPASDKPFRVRLARQEKSSLRLVDEGNSVLVLLPSSPIVNPDVLALVDAPAATGIAGNSYFNPFVWDGVHYFQFTYDKLGRLDTAHEIGADNVVRFQWEGERLTAIRAGQASATRPSYVRTQHYSGKQLASETVEFRGKTYKIEYKYAGDRPREASFDDNGAHDGRQWRVRFE